MKNFNFSIPTTLDDAKQLAAKVQASKAAIAAGKVGRGAAIGTFTLGMGMYALVTGLAATAVDTAQTMHKTAKDMAAQGKVPMTVEEKDNLILEARATVEKAKAAGELGPTDFTLVTLAGMKTSSEA